MQRSTPKLTTLPDRSSSKKDLGQSRGVLVKGTGQVLRNRIAQRLRCGAIQWLKNRACRPIARCQVATRWGSVLIWATNKPALRGGSDQKEKKQQDGGGQQDKQNADHRLKAQRVGHDKLVGREATEVNDVRAKCKCG